MSKATPDFFNQEMAVVYDQRNSKLTPIVSCSHFLLSLILQELPSRSRILCVGAGTGAKILALSQIYPEWSFVALDPSLPMLEICHKRVQEAGVADRCKYVHGYLQDLSEKEEFDGVLSILVGHFVPRNERAIFYQEMVNRLKVGGILVDVEISFDLDSKEFSSMLKNWEAIQTLMGATPESLEKLPEQLKEMLTVLPPQELIELIRKGGIKVPLPFFQAFMVQGIYGKKEI